jgi:uncharacterized membrane protein YphA (DoxX/SURF4 family)
MRAFLNFCRLFVGSLFIVSGLIKANDTLGFSYKLEEYFAETALNLPFLEPFALALAGLACLAEIVLGFAVLFGGKMKLATWSLLILTVFFGWLTAYTATCDPQATFTVVENGMEIQKGVTCVTDCGCFGDAMKGSIGRSLTPWESFSKDMVLLVFILPMFFFRNRITWNSDVDDKTLLPLGLILVAFFSWVFTWYFPVLFFVIGVAGYLAVKKFMLSDKAEWISAGWITLISLLLMNYTYNHLPLRDYRPYAIGKNLPGQMVIPEGEQPDLYETVLVYRNKDTGEEKEFSSTDYPWDNPVWEWVSTENKLIKRGFTPPITDLSLFDQDGVDVTESVLSADQPVLWFVSYDISKASISDSERINALVQEAYDNGMYVYGISSSGHEDTERFRHEHGLQFDYLNCDGIVLKTIIRSNPGLVVLNGGTVIGKWSEGDMPTYSDMKEATGL